MSIQTTKREFSLGVLSAMNVQILLKCQSSGQKPERDVHYNIEHTPSPTNRRRMAPPT